MCGGAVAILFSFWYFLRLLCSRELGYRVDMLDELSLKNACLKKAVVVLDFLISWFLEFDSSLDCIRSWLCLSLMPDLDLKMGFQGLVFLQTVCVCVIRYTVCSSTYFAP